MKLVAKIFIIIGMIFQCFLIYPLILGAIMLGKLKKATKADDIGIGWKVITLLFVNLIAGVVLLVMKDSDYTA